jgi:hypothetical protein
MKDELCRKKMHEFVGLRAKLYSFNFLEKNVLSTKNTAKGVKKIVKDRDIKIEDYKRCLRDSQIKSVKINSIRSDHHQLFTLTSSKIALSAADNKRYICDNGINTLAHGHYQNN